MVGIKCFAKKCNDYFRKLFKSNVAVKLTIVPKNTDIVDIAKIFRMQIRQDPQQCSGSVSRFQGSISFHRARYRSWEWKRRIQKKPPKALYRHHKSH